MSVSAPKARILIQAREAQRRKPHRTRSKLLCGRDKARVGLFFRQFPAVLCSLDWLSGEVMDIDPSRRQFIKGVVASGIVAGAARHGFTMAERRSMQTWCDQLDKAKGSRPRCVLLVEGERQSVAKRLTDLVGDPMVEICNGDFWMPRGKPFRRGISWDASPADEPRLDRDGGFVPPWVQGQLGDWWLAVKRGANTPNWDFASTCQVEEKRGLLLVEAKAHTGELSDGGTGARNVRNLTSIGAAISEANDALVRITGGDWRLSKDHHYQVANRFAWSWKLASLGIPVVLVYLGFLCAEEMREGENRPFAGQEDWANVVRTHTLGVVDEACWGKRLEVNGTPLRPLVRTVEQPLLCR